MPLCTTMIYDDKIQMDTKLPCIDRTLKDSVTKTLKSLQTIHTLTVSFAHKRNITVLLYTIEID